VIPAAFDYTRPASLDEALKLLSTGSGSKVIAGGQSLLPLLKLRLGSVDHLVDIGRIPGLDGLGEVDGGLRIGALVREAALESSDVVRQKYPILLDTAKVIADPIVRNRATVCGNLAHGDPGNDHPATMIALRAEVVARGPNGERVIPVIEFFKGLFTTALTPDEILVEIRIPAPPARSGGAYVKLERKVGDYATVGVAAITRMDGGSIGWAGIGITGASDNPYAAEDAEAVLAGNTPSDDLFRRAGEAAAAQASPVADLRGPVDYKRAMITELTVRALRSAVERGLAYS